MAYMKPFLPLFAAVLSIASAPTAFASFSDIPSYHLYGDAIEYAADAGLAKGYPDGTFRPDQTVNRAEFFTLVERFFLEDAQPASPKPSFKDTNGTEWFFPAVEKSYGLKLIGGYPDGSLKPEKMVTFAEASKVLVRLAQPDLAEGSIWFEPFVRALQDQKAIPLSIVAFDQPLSRGEVMEMLWRVKEKKTDQKSHTWDELRTGKAFPAAFAIPSGYVFHEVAQGSAAMSSILSADHKPGGFGISATNGTPGDDEVPEYVGTIMFEKKSYDHIIDELHNSLQWYYVDAMEDAAEREGESMPPCAVEKVSAIKKTLHTPVHNVIFELAIAYGGMNPPKMPYDPCDKAFDSQWKAFADDAVDNDIFAVFLIDSGEFREQEAMIFGTGLLKDVPTDIDCKSEVICEEMVKRMKDCQKRYANAPDTSVTECTSPMEDLMRGLKTYVFINDEKFGPFAYVSELAFGDDSTSIFVATDDWRTAHVFLNGKDQKKTYDRAGGVRKLPDGRSFSYSLTQNKPKRTAIMIDDKEIAVNRFVEDVTVDDNGSYAFIEKDVLASKQRVVVNGTDGEWMDDIRSDLFFRNGSVLYVAKTADSYVLMRDLSQVATWKQEESRITYDAISSDGTVAAGKTEFAGELTVYINGNPVDVSELQGYYANTVQWSANGEEISFKGNTLDYKQKFVRVRVKNPKVLSIEDAQ